MDRRLEILVISTFGYVIKGTTQVREGAFRPVSVVYYLHFQIYDCVGIQFHLDIKIEIFIIHMFTQLNWICNPDRCDAFHFQMEQRTDQSLEYGVVSLHESTEQIVIGHADRDVLLHCPAI